MFRILRWGQDGRLKTTEDTAAPIAADEWVWLHLEGESAEAEDRLLAALGIAVDDLVLLDARRERHPPKYERFEGLDFLVLRELQVSASHEAPDTQNLAVLIGERFLVTRAFQPSPVVAAVLEELLSGAKPATLQTRLEPTLLAHRLMRRLVEAYPPMLMALEEELGDIEDQILRRPQEAHLSQLMAYNSAIKRLHRRLVYQTAALKTLTESETGRHRHLFHDLYENSERCTSLCHLYQALMADLINGVLSLNSYRLNRVMRVLTVVTVIFMPLTLIAGIYGMNFGWMPELQWRYGYFAVLAGMLLLTLGMLLMFRRLRWL